MSAELVPMGKNFVDMPANFPFKNDDELAAANYMKGRHFLYHSKYSKTPMLLVCKHVIVAHNLMEREVVDGQLKIRHNVAHVYIVTNTGANYEWEKCELIEPETSAESV